MTLRERIAFWILGWRPIATAPKGAPEILTFAPEMGIAVSYYATEVLDSGEECETWRDDGGVPTHWMPLPSPPEPPQ